MSDDDPTFPPPALIPGRAAQAQPSARRAGPDAAYQAHALGQDGRRRGLKGGRPVLEAAAAAYLDTEWSGPSDRRRPAGGLKRRDV